MLQRPTVLIPEFNLALSKADVFDFLTAASGLTLTGSAVEAEAGPGIAELAPSALPTTSGISSGRLNVRDFAGLDADLMVKCISPCSTDPSPSFTIVECPRGR